ncbi:hypothetical protein [Asticcacaulis sp.]|uniref:hypothetical protein n=1 Tax=Asticcacaulis sp. TaxID=1872648 RepID=UPI00263297B7|nr:hypothetical protein [Asticcacaulis sp.]
MPSTQEAGVDPGVKSKFDAVIAFRFPSANSPAIRQRIETDAEHEAGSSRPLRLNVNGMTSGMQAACVKPAIDALEEFDTLVHGFDNAIEPYRGEMDALDGLDRTIANLRRDFSNAQVRAEEAFLKEHKYVEAKTAFAIASAKYHEEKLRHNNIDARVFPILAYILILFAIGGLEWAINYMAILEKFGVPAFALGFSAVIGSAVAFASHEHGTLLKQWDHWFGPQNEERKKVQKFVWSCFATVALLLVMGFVGWNRYTWVQAEISRSSAGAASSVFGNSAGPVINIGQEVAMTLFANILVYIIGLAIAYWCHDKDPDYATHFKVFIRARKVWDGWKAKVSQEKTRLEHVLTNEIAAEESKAKALQLRSQPLNQLRSQVLDQKERIETQAVTYVSSLIREYKMALVDFAKVSNPTISFIMAGGQFDLDRYIDTKVVPSLQTVRPELSPPEAATA